MLYYPQLQNGCKLNGEMLYILDYVVSGRSEFDMIRENRIAKQKEAFRAVFGKWRDSRSTDQVTCRWSWPVSNFFKVAVEMK